LFELGFHEGQPAMVDYYPMLARAVSKLAINNTQARQEVYQRARTALAAELRRQSPQKSGLETLRERSALETAIRRVEAELLSTPTLTPQGQMPPRPAAKYADVAKNGNDIGPLGDRLKANEARAQTAPEPGQPEEIAGSKRQPQERKQTNPEAIVSTISAASAGQRERRPVTIQDLDRADLEEIFPDSIIGLICDGETLRVEFGVTRLDKKKANSAITARRYPVCRLVLPLAAAVDFINRMHQIAPALTPTGAVKSVPLTGAEETNAG
jgi:hypothetical protein